MEDPLPVEAEADRTEVQAPPPPPPSRPWPLLLIGPEREQLAPLSPKPKVKVTVHAAGTDQIIRLFQPDPAMAKPMRKTAAEGPIYKISPSIIKGIDQRPVRASRTSDYSG